MKSSKDNNGMQKKVRRICLCRRGTTAALVATLGVIESASGSFRDFLPIVKLREWVDGYTREAVDAHNAFIGILSK